MSVGENLIEFSDKSKRKRVALCSYPYWNEYKDEEREEYSSKQRKVMQAHIQSIFMKRADVKK